MTTGCHPESYRWSAETPATFSGTLEPPAGSKFGSSWKDPGVTVYSFSTPSIGRADAVLTDLSDQGQAALIAALTAPGADPEKVRDALAKPLTGKVEPAEDASTVEGAYKRTLVANVTKGWNARPGERLVWTWIYIRPVNFEFDGYTVLATDNRVLNIEQVSSTTAAGLTASLGKTGSNTTSSNTAGSPVSSALSTVAGTSAGVGGSLSGSQTTSASINQQFVGLGADIVPEELRIFRESERNLDVAGNTLIALTMRLNPSKWSKVVPDISLRVTAFDVTKPDGAMKAANEITFNVMENKAPPSCDLTARVMLFYEYRHVRNGRSYIEGEQDARYRKDIFDAGEIPIMRAGEVRKPAWRVYPKADPEHALQVIGPFENDLPIDFTSYEQAQAFAVWIMSKSSSVSGRMAPPIGQNGLRLSSGIDGQSVYPGDYFARQFVKPEASDAEHNAMVCGGMRVPTALPAAIKVP